MSFPICAAVKTIQPDLFACPPPGLTLRPALIDAAEAGELVAHIDALALQPFRFQGWTGKRVTASFGWHYDFDGGRLARADPLPGWLLPVRARAAAFAGLAEDALAQALLIRYDPGAGIGWHHDRPVFDHVVGVSLGAPATLRFRRRRPDGFDRHAVPLVPGGAYHLHGAARRDWEHGIAPMADTRWSITFRSLRA